MEHSDMTEASQKIQKKTCQKKKEEYNPEK